jgi:hypothetical protein
MKKILLLLIGCSVMQSVTAQVGIGTISPEPSAILDISSTDQGLLVPRVNLIDVTNTMLDGSNPAATGLLIWNTNASTVGGNGVGYYSFNGSIWEKLSTVADNVPVILKVSSTTSSTSYAQGSNLILFLNSVSHNSGGGSYDTATGTYTVPTDGLYEIRTSFNVTLAAPDYEMLMSNRIYLNSVYHATTIEQLGSFVNTSFGITYSTTFIEQFSAGDLVEMRTTNLSNAAVYGGASTAGRSTWLTIKKID